MRNVFCSVLFFTLFAVPNIPSLGQGQGPLGYIFQGQTPPPGAVSVLGRSLAGALENGFGNSLTLLIATGNKNVRQEIGMTEAEVNSIRLLQTQMAMNAPKYVARFKTMTEADQKSIQEDIERDMGRITEYVNKSLEPERKGKVQQFIFQSLGGIDSPLIGMGAMEALNLSDDQRKKLQSVFDEAKEERMERLESMLIMAEKAVAAGGPRNLSAEDRKAGQELEAEFFAAAKILAERLRQHLTPEQLEKEKQLIASRPAFLPGLPRQMQRQKEARTESGGTYIPGAKSWRPGQDLPVQMQEQRIGRFPRTLATDTIDLEEVEEE